MGAAPGDPTTSSTSSSSKQIQLRTHSREEDLHLPSQPGRSPSSSAACLPSFHTPPAFPPFPRARFPDGCFPEPDRNPTASAFGRLKNQKVAAHSRRAVSQSSQGTAPTRAAADDGSCEFLSHCSHVHIRAVSVRCGPGGHQARTSYLLIPAWGGAFYTFPGTKRTADLVRSCSPEHPYGCQLTLTVSAFDICKTTP